MSERQEAGNDPWPTENTANVEHVSHRPSVHDHAAQSYTSTTSEMNRWPTAEQDGPGSSHYRQGRTRTAQESITPADGLRPSRTEKPQQQYVDLDNRYYTLNPWHDEQPRRPVFGLAQPLPRTVRKGMLWGQEKREPMYKVEEWKARGSAQQPHKDSTSSADDTRDEGKESIDRQQALQGFQVPLGDSHGEEAPDQFDTNIQGRRASVRRLGSSEANDVLRKRGAESDFSGNQLQISHSQNRPKRNTFGLQDGLPPLQEHATSGTANTTETTAEDRETREINERARQQYYDTYRNPLARLRAKHPQAPAEFLATFVTIFLGICGNLSVTTSNSAQGGFQTEAWAWGLAVMTGIYLGGGISGAHLNPFVSITLSLFRGFPWGLCIVYIVTQLCAGFCGAALAWLIYRDAILHIDPSLTANITGKAFYTLPQTFVSTPTAFFTEFLSSAIVICVVFALGDDQNSPPGAGMNAFILGLVNYLLIITLGYNTGPAVSPARDFGPRLVALAAGYGSQTFTDGWWVYGPWAAGLSGSVAGALVYDIMVFTGGESPVNYRWPTPKEVGTKLMQGKGLVKEKVEKSHV